MNGPARGIFRYLLSLAALCGALGRLPAAAEDDLRAAFLAQYEPHAAALAERYGSAQYRFTSRSPGGPNRQQLQVVAGKFDLHHHRVSGESSFVDLTTNAKTAVSTGSIEVQNTRYAFTVRNQGEKGYALHEIAIYAEQGFESQQCLLCFPFADNARRKTYLELIRAPDTTVLGHRTVTWRGRPVTELQVEYTIFHRGEKRTKRVRGTYYFEPSTGWVCVGTRTPADNTGKYHERVHSYDTSGAWAVPVKYELWEMNEQKPDANKRLWDITIDEFTPIPKLDPAEFTLTAFGIPEPVGVKWEKPVSRYVWLLIAAGTCAVLALGFRYLGRKRPVATT